MNSYVIYLAPALGILGLLVMAIKSAWVSKQDAGDAKMQELAGHIADGAMAFLEGRMESAQHIRCDHRRVVGIFRNDPRR